MDSIIYPHRSLFYTASSSKCRQFFYNFDKIQQNENFTMNMDSYEDIMCQDKIQYYSCSAFQACYCAPYTVGRILSFLFLK